MFRPMVHFAIALFCLAWTAPVFAFAKEPLDLILLDPPYGTGAGAVAVDKLVRLGWIGEGTWVSLETHADEVPQIKACEVESERKVGKARLTLLRLKTKD